MPGFDGTGPNGMGPMTGGGRGFCNPRGIGATARRYGFPRYPGYGAYGFQPFAPRMTRAQELEFLKGQAGALSDELKQLETEIGKLSVEKSEE